MATSTSVLAPLLPVPAPRHRFRPSPSAFPRQLRLSPTPRLLRAARRRHPDAVVVVPDARPWVGDLSGAAASYRDGSEEDEDVGELEDEDDEDRSLDLLARFLHSVFRKASRRARRAARSVLPPSVPAELVKFSVNGVLVLTFLWILKGLLERFYALDRFGSATCLTKLRYLPSLRELQLIMLEMDSANLAYIYVFFRCCWCPQLEKIFVQLPLSIHESFMDNSLEVAEEEEDEPDEMLFEIDEPDEELHEDGDPDEEEDEPDEELSEGYEAEEKLLLEEISEEYMLEERLYYEDVYEEDPPEEDVPEDEQSEEDVPEDEQSEEVLKLYGLNNLVFAKLMKFKGHYHYFEMRLVNFLLRRATHLQKLLLVPPVGVGNYMEAPGEKPLDTSCFRETILNFEKASPDVQIVLSDSDPAAIQPVHSDVF